jgi:hypothetical protein
MYGIWIGMSSGKPRYNSSHQVNTQSKLFFLSETSVSLSRIKSLNNQVTNEGREEDLNLQVRAPCRAHNQ